MPVEYVQIEQTSILVEPGEIIKLLADQQGIIDSYTTDLFNRYIERCISISSPTAAFILTEAIEAVSSHHIAIPGASFHPGKVIRDMLQHSESYALFMVTAGPEPENLARKLLAESNYLEGYIADLVASSIVELAADQVQEHIRELADKLTLNITNRYSPGYCSWNVEEQQKLFRLFPADCCGISLSESSLMNPVKSASGIIGIGSLVKYRDYTCEICSMLNCQFRKTKEH